MQKIKSINALRGIWAILIFLHHFLPSYGVKYNIDLGNRGVLFFFIVSGFLLGFKYYKADGGYTLEAKSFIIKRLSKIYPIQWIILSLCVVLGIKLVSWWAIPFQFTLTQAIVPLWEIDFTLCAGSWFLSALMFCYLAFPFIIKAINKNLNISFITYLLLLTAFSLLVIYLPDSIGRRWLCYINPFARILDFSFGVFMGVLFRCNKSKIEKCPRWISSLLEIVIVVATCICVIIQPKGYTPTVWLYTIIGGLVFIFTMDNGIISKVFDNSVSLNLLGDISLCIYMTHEIIYHFMIKAIHLHWLPEMLIILAVVIIISWLLQKYFIPWSSNLFVKGAYKLFPDKAASE